MHVVVLKSFWLLISQSKGNLHKKQTEKLFFFYQSTHPQWAKIKVHITLIKWKYEIDLSMNNILTKLLSNKKRLNNDLIHPKNFELKFYVHFFKDFQYTTFRDFLCFQITLTQSIFELEKCSFFLNRSQGYP